MSFYRERQQAEHLAETGSNRAKAMLKDWPVWQSKFVWVVPKEMADKIKRLDKVEIPTAIDFKLMTALSSEAREKFTKLRPQTLGQASRISGISPADVSILLVHLGR